MNPAKDPKLENRIWKLGGRGSILGFRFSDFEFRPARWLTPLATAVAFFATASAAYAQCAMCKASASSLKERAIEALQSGVFILLIPPMLMFVGIMVTAFRRRNRFNEPESEESLPLGDAREDRLAPLSPERACDYDPVRLDIR